MRHLMDVCWDLVVCLSGASGRQFWSLLVAVLGPRLGLLGTSWGVLADFGSLLELLWGLLGPPGGLLEASREPLGGLLGPPGGLLGWRPGFLGSWSLSWASLGAFLGPLGRLERLLGRLGAVFGPSREPFGPSWSGLGGLLGGLGTSESGKIEEAKNIGKTNENQRFWRLGPLLEVHLERSWGLWEASGAVLNPS